MREKTEDKKNPNYAEYDVHIDLTNPDFYFNAEMKNDFLTGHMDMALYA